MGFKTHGPHVVSFLEFVHQQYPDVSSFRQMDEYDLRDAQRRFSDQLPRSLKRQHIPIKNLIHNGFYRDEIAGYSTVPSRRVFFNRHNLSDALSTYLSAPFRSVFLYTDFDRDFIDALREIWHGLDRESGKLLHFFDFGESPIRMNGRRSRVRYTFSEEFIRGLAPIPGANVRRIREFGLPCLLLWSDTKYELISFSDISGDRKRIIERFREILSVLQSIDNLEYFSNEFQNDHDVIGVEEVDVFISYQRDDRPIVERVSNFLEEAGFKVWYDAHIRIGKYWNNEIWRHLAAAKLTVVVWTSRSISSEYVLAEADKARNLKRLFPLFIEQDLDLPAPFNTIQGLPLPLMQNLVKSSEPIKLLIEEVRQRVTRI